jgi:hypothetical protein
MSTFFCTNTEGPYSLGSYSYSKKLLHALHPFPSGNGIPCIYALSSKLVILLILYAHNMMMSAFVLGKFEQLSQDVSCILLRAMATRMFDKKRGKALGKATA